MRIRSVPGLVLVFCLVGCDSLSGYRYKLYEPASAPLQVQALRTKVTRWHQPTDSAPLLSTSTIVLEATHTENATPRRKYVLTAEPLITGATVTVARVEADPQVLEVRGGSGNFSGNRPIGRGPRIRAESNGDFANLIDFTITDGGSNDVVQLKASSQDPLTVTLVNPHDDEPQATKTLTSGMFLKTIQQEDGKDKWDNNGDAQPIPDHEEPLQIERSIESAIQSLRFSPP